MDPTSSQNQLDLVKLQESLAEVASSKRLDPRGFINNIKASHIGNDDSSETQIIKQLAELCIDKTKENYFNPEQMAALCTVLTSKEFSHFLDKDEKERILAVANAALKTEQSTVKDTHFQKIKDALTETDAEALPKRDIAKEALLKRWDSIPKELRPSTTSHARPEERTDDQLPPMNNADKKTIPSTVQEINPQTTTSIEIK